MAENDEVVTLLREIRDLQKAHFDRYAEFTTAVITRNDEAKETQSRLIASTQRTREEARADAAKWRLTLIICTVATIVMLFAASFAGSFIMELIRR